jgi:hypothetical protein
MNNKLQLILNNSTGEKKNKQIDAIAKKLTKIEQLIIEQERTVQKVKKLKIQVDEQSTASKLFFCQSKEKYILILTKKYALKGLTKWQKDIISDLINEELELLDDMDYKSQAIQDAMTIYLKIQKDQMSSSEKLVMEEGMKNFFEQFSLDFGIEDFDLSKMNDPEFKKEFEEKIKAKQKEEQEKNKQLLKEKQVENTDVDLQKIYKKLAKIAHPDLFKNKDKKAVKELQMQKLTIAWEERNYYEILTLWLEIDPENTIELEITERNQKSILKQLNEKINTLEAETYRIKFHYEDTAFYYQNFNAPSDKGTLSKINKYIKTLEITAEKTTFILENIQNTSKLKAFLEEIYDSQQMEDYYFN